MTSIFINSILDQPKSRSTCFTFHFRMSFKWKFYGNCLSLTFRIGKLAYESEFSFKFMPKRMNALCEWWKSRWTKHNYNRMNRIFRCFPFRNNEMNAKEMIKTRNQPVVSEKEDGFIQVRVLNSNMYIYIHAVAKTYAVRLVRFFI